jgi:hypothetical protein
MQGKKNKSRRTRSQLEASVYVHLQVQDLSRAPRVTSRIERVASRVLGLRYVPLRPDQSVLSYLEIWQRVSRQENARYRDALFFEPSTR